MFISYYNHTPCVLCFRDLEEALEMGIDWSLREGKQTLGCMGHHSDSVIISLSQMPNDFTC